MHSKLSIIMDKVIVPDQLVSAPTQLVGLKQNNVNPLHRDHRGEIVSVDHPAFSAWLKQAIPAVDCKQKQKRDNSIMPQWKILPFSI